MRAGRLLWLLALLVLMGSPAVNASAQAEPVGSEVEAQSAKVWLGREAELEEYLRQVEAVDMEPIGTGVTHPWKVHAAPGGPIEKFAWKPIKPGFYSGYAESYKSEVAAYELDKLLGLGMVPVTVEREIDGSPGAACMWVSPTQSFKDLGDVPTPPAAEKERWSWQLTRAKMFDLLINNIDPNLGNWLVDPAWNIILIDHSRAFTNRRGKVHELTRVDPDLWERMQQLDETALTGALGSWLSPKQIRAIIKQRDRMQKEISRLSEAR